MNTAMLRHASCRVMTFPGPRYRITTGSAHMSAYVSRSLSRHMRNLRRSVSSSSNMRVEDRIKRFLVLGAAFYVLVLGSGFTVTAIGTRNQEPEPRTAEPRT